MINFNINNSRLKCWLKIRIALLNTNWQATLRALCHSVIYRFCDFPFLKSTKIELLISGACVLRVEWGKPHFRLNLSWLVEWQVLDQWKSRMRHVGCELCVTQLPETSGFLADPKLPRFCLVGNRICRVRKARLQKTLTSSRIVWGVTSILHRLSAGSSRLVNLRPSTTNCWCTFREWRNFLIYWALLFLPFPIFHWDFSCYESAWDWSEKHWFSL